MIPLAVPNLSGNERKYLNECIDTTFVSSVGEFVTRLEDMCKNVSGAKCAVATSAGTTALHLALMGVGVKPNDLVIMPTFTFIASANAAAHAGAMPWLMDIELESWTINTEQIEFELKNKAQKKSDGIYHKTTDQRIAAILPVYTLGAIPNMDKIGEIAKYYNLPIVADAAAAIGANYSGKNLGEIADVTVFSFNGNKTVTAGGGGMIVGNDEKLLNKLRHISTTARVTAEYDHDMIGYNYRMTNLQAAVGCAQMEQLDRFLERKRFIRDFYRKELSNISKISFFPEPKNQKNTCWFSGIVLQDGKLEKIRSLCQKLRDNDIEGRSFWKPIHLQKPYKNAIKADSLEIADNLWNKILTLPSSTSIKDEELMQVVNVIKNFL